MKTLIFFLAIICAGAAATGIFSDDIYPVKEITTVRGRQVTLYAKGLYHDMSEQVAPQGIAQDVVTLFLAIPLLFLTLTEVFKNPLLNKIFQTGILGYLMVTYLFYLMMGMYNNLFLVWTAALSLSFFLFLNNISTLDAGEIMKKAESQISALFTGGFLVFAAFAIAILWLSIIIPPLIQNKIPTEVEHYTTLVVQGLDLAILLPAAVVSGIMLIRKRKLGYLFSAVYLVFLSLLMLALTAKVIAMKLLGYDVIPAIIIIPAFTVITTLLMAMFMKALCAENRIVSV